MHNKNNNNNNNRPNNTLATLHTTNLSPFTKDINHSFVIILGEPM